MDNRNPQDKQNQKLNPNEHNKHEEKHPGSQDREHMDASKRDGQQHNQNQNKNPQQPKH